MNLTDRRKILITCAKGLGDWVANELEDLGYEVLIKRSNGVEIEGDWLDVMRLNLELRTALAVLYLFHEFNASRPKDYYKTVNSLPWEELISPSEYISIVSRADTPTINNTMYVGQLTKDAIVDRIVDKTGSRPNSGPKRDNIVINVFWMGQRCWLYLNTSGNKLADRGYRKMPFKAPLQETLAAAILIASGYDGSQPLVLPMCGSGTLAIEAALIALKRRVGLLRNNFSFMHLLNYDKETWKDIRLEALKKGAKKLVAPIIATDIDEGAIEASVNNATTAGVAHLIDFSVCDFAKTSIPKVNNGIILMNPEYGERLGDVKELEKTYRRIGDFFKNSCRGYSGYVFTGNLKLAKHIGLRTSKRFIFQNAKIECRLLKYEIYEGSRKSKYQVDGDA